MKFRIAFASILFAGLAVTNAYAQHQPQHYQYHGSFGGYGTAQSHFHRGFQGGSHVVRGRSIGQGYNQFVTGYTYPTQQAAGAFHHGRNWAHQHQYLRHSHGSWITVSPYSGVPRHNWRHVNHGIHSYDYRR